MTPFRPTRAELDALLAEDTPHGDLTTEALGITDRWGSMRFEARDAMVVAGIEVARGLIETVVARVLPLVDDGVAVAAGTTLLVAEGPAGSLHRAWKTAQTTVELLSGIASAAREVVDAAAAGGRVVPVACTRKTFPGARRFQLAAIRAGGCVIHRAGLSETVLVFAEHRVFLDDTPLETTVARLRASCPEKKLVIEVATPEAAVSAARAGFDVIQMEKFSPAQVAETVARVRPVAARVVLASAGGISPANAADHVRAGADMLVTSWPYTARPRDVQVTLGPECLDGLRAP